jgi:hypothetical protein
MVPATAAAVETANDGAMAPTKAAEMARVTTEAAGLVPAMKSVGHGAEARAVEVNARVAAPARESTAEQMPADPQTPQVKTDQVATILNREQIREAALKLHTTRPNRPKSCEIFPRAMKSLEAEIQFSWAARQARPRVQAMRKVVATPLEMELARTPGILSAAAEAGHRYRPTRRVSGSTRAAVANPLRARHPRVR